MLRRVSSAPPAESRDAIARTAGGAAHGVEHAAASAGCVVSHGIMAFADGTEQVLLVSSHDALGRKEKAVLGGRERSREISRSRFYSRCQYLPRGTLRLSRVMDPRSLLVAPLVQHTLHGASWERRAFVALFRQSSLQGLHVVGCRKEACGLGPWRTRWRTQSYLPTTDTV